MCVSLYSKILTGYLSTIVKHFTRFCWEEEPEKAFKSLSNALSHMSFITKLSPKTGRIDVKSKTSHGILKFIIQLYILTEKIVMADFIQKAGQVVDFFKVYKSIREEFKKDKQQQSEDIEIS